MTRPPQQLSLSHLLALGFRQSASLAPATLSLAAARALGSIALMVLAWGLLEFFLAGQAAVGVGIASGLLVLWLAAELLEGVVLAGALRQGRQRMLGAGVPPILDAIVHEARRGLTFPLWLGALQLFQTLWRWGALIGGLTLYFRAFEGRGSGLVASVALALAVIVPLVLGLLLWVWLRVGLVQAVHEGQSVSVGLFEATGLLRAGIGLPLLILLVFGLFAFFGEALVTTVVTPLSSVRDASPLTLLRLASLSSIMAVCVGSIPMMLFEHAGWQGLMAWRLGRDGMLPPESLPAPRTARIVRAEPALAGAGAGGGMVLDAAAVTDRGALNPDAGSPGATGSEPIVEARPTTGIPHAEPIIEATPIAGLPGTSADEGAIVEAVPVEGEGDSTPGNGTDPTGTAGGQASADSSANPSDTPEAAPQGGEPTTATTSGEPRGSGAESPDSREDGHPTSPGTPKKSSD